jgi:hypothetical protein
MFAMPRWLVVSLISLVAAGIVAMAAGIAFIPRRIELLHIAFVNACVIRTYQYHWQDATRLRQNFRYDFTMSPDSFVMAEVWVVDGPILSFSQNMPIECAIHN